MVLIDVRTCTVETARARESVQEFFKACVPVRLRPYFSAAAERHHLEKNSQVQKLKKALETPSDVQSHVMNCSNYVKESKALIRAVAFVLLRAFPDGLPYRSYQD